MTEAAVLVGVFVALCRLVFVYLAFDRLARAGFVFDFLTRAAGFGRVSCGTFISSFSYSPQRPRRWHWRNPCCPARPALRARG